MLLPLEELSRRKPAENLKFTANSSEGVPVLGNRGQ